MSPSSTFELSLPARADSVTVVRHVLGGVAGVWPVDAALLDDILIAVTEACANVVNHAYRDASGGALEVRCAIEDGNPVVVVRDHGPGIVSGDDSPGLGMGIPLMGALTDQLSSGHAEDGAHEVRLSFARDAS